MNEDGPEPSRHERGIMIRRVFPVSGQNRWLFADSETGNEVEALAETISEKGEHLYALSVSFGLDPVREITRTIIYFEVNQKLELITFFPSKESQGESGNWKGVLKGGAVAEGEMDRMVDAEKQFFSFVSEISKNGKRSSKGFDPDIGI